MRRSQVVAEVPSEVDLSQADYVNKPLEILVLFPKFGRLSATARKVYNVLIQQSRAEIYSAKTAGTVLDLTHMFKIPVSRVIGYSLNGPTALPYLKECFTSLQETEVDCSAPDKNSKIIWRSVKMIGEVRYVNDDDGHMIYWQLPVTLIELLRNMDQYASIDLDSVAKLERYAAIALYEICSRYKDNPGGVTSKHTPEWWTDALTSTTPQIDPATGLPKPRPWRVLKSMQVNHAIEEINSLTDIEIGLIEEKTGKAVTAIQFSVKRKQSKQLELTKEAPLYLIEKADSLGIMASDVVGFLKNGYTETQVAIMLDRLEARNKKSGSAPIENPAAYVRAALKADFGPDAVKAAEDVPLERSNPESFPVLKVEEPAPVAPVAPASKKASASKSVSKSISDLVAKLESLSNDQLDDVLKKVFFGDAEVQPAVFTLRTGALKNAIQKRDWSSVSFTSRVAVLEKFFAEGGV